MGKELGNWSESAIILPHAFCMKPSRYSEVWMMKDNSIVNAMYDIVPTLRREITLRDDHKIKVMTSWYMHDVLT